MQIVSGLDKHTGHYGDNGDVIMGTHGQIASYCWHCTTALETALEMFTNLFTGVRC